MDNIQLMIWLEANKTDDMDGYYERDPGDAPSPEQLQHEAEIEKEECELRFIQANCPCIECGGTPDDLHCFKCTGMCTRCAST